MSFLLHRPQPTRKTGKGRYATYLAAVERERDSWEAVEQAAVALASLRAEACAATVRVSVDDRWSDADWWAEQWATAEPVRVAAA